MYTNGKKIFATKTQKSSDVMYCLNGIRVLSIIWVIIGHVYVWRILEGASNLAYVLDVSIINDIHNNELN